MELLEKYFDTAFDSPNGIKELRRLILKLAMMGKLVPQDPKDHPACELLKEIQAEKNNLIAEGKIKKQKPQPAIRKEEIPYEVPNGWRWVRIWDIAQLITSGSRDWAKYYSDYGAIFVTMGNLSRGSYELRMDTIRFVSPPKNGEGSRTKLEQNDLLISITGDVGNLGLIPGNFGEAYINQHTCLLRFVPACRNLYFPEMMRSPLAKYQFDAPQRGIKNSFRLSDVGLMIVPLPPLNEQKRIVAKINELMARCDEMERLKTEQTEKRRRTNAAALHRLLKSPDRESFTDSFSFITRKFSHIYGAKENVEELEKAVLQLAMMGKLVPQDPKDQPAGELLTEIQAEKERLIAEGKIRRQKPLPEIKPEEIPYELPEGWVWCRLGEIVSKIGSGSTPKGGKESYVQSGIMFFRSQNVYNDGIRTEKISYISERIHEKMKGTQIKPLDILFNITGGSLGRSALVPEDFTEGNISQHVCIIRPIFIDPKFMHLTSLSGYFHDHIPLAITGGGREGLQKNKMELFPIALPPLNEQKRIVRKTNELMGLCDNMIEKIDGAEETRENLLQSVLAQV